MFFSHIIRHQRAARTASQNTTILMHSDNIENLQTFHATIRHAQLLAAHEPHDT